MRSVLLAAVLLLPACFHPNYDHPACGPGGACPSGFNCDMTSGFCERPGADLGDDAGVDAPGMATDASVMFDAIHSTFCDPITGLVACYEFEGNAKDGSGNGLDATTTNVTFVPGKVGQAMQVAADSSAIVNANDLFDNVSRFTIEAWIRPSTSPGSGGSYILAVGIGYWLAINSDGTLVCVMFKSGLATGRVTTTTTVTIGQWTHVACTYDGAAAVLNVYINGSVAGTHTGGGPPGNGANDMGIAGPPGPQPVYTLVGLIDQLRLLNVARSAAAICTDAGMTSCP